MAGADGRARGRVALFPLPIQGHLSPMLQLAGALHAPGFAVVVLHTTYNAPDPASHKEFAFVAVPDGMTDAVAKSKDGIAKVHAINAAMEASGCIRDALAPVLSAEPRLACLVIDSTLPAAQKAAKQLGLPTLVLHTSSAACTRLFRSYPMLHEKGYLPAQGYNANSFSDKQSSEGGTLVVLVAGEGSYDGSLEWLKWVAGRLTMLGEVVS